MQSPRGGTRSSRLYDILMKLSTVEEATSSFDDDPKERFAQLANRLLLNPSLSTRKRRIVESSSLGAPEKRTKETSEGSETTHDAIDGSSSVKQSSLEESAPKEKLEKDKLAALEKEIEEESNTRRQEFMEKMTGLRSLYLHGLERVSKLQDLRDAPDAILPGNLIVPTKEDLAEPSDASASFSGNLQGP